MSTMADVEELAQFIRRIDGNHSLGAGALAERIIEAGYSNKPDVWERNQRFADRSQS